MPGSAGEDPRRLSPPPTVAARSQLEGLAGGSHQDNGRWATARMARGNGGAGEGAPPGGESLRATKPAPLGREGAARASQARRRPVGWRGEATGGLTLGLTHASSRGEARSHPLDGGEVAVACTACAGGSPVPPAFPRPSTPQRRAEIYGSAAAVQISTVGTTSASRGLAVARRATGGMRPGS